MPLVLLAVLLTGCGRNTGDSSTSEVKENEIVDVVDYGKVALASIKTPKFEDDFATLSVGTRDIPVYWGSGNLVFAWSYSGYPGFDYPIVIESAYDIVVADTATLTTSWGVYDYSLCSTGSAFKESNNLRDKESGDWLVNWGKLGEMLIVWSSQSCKYSIYNLEGGTEIVLEAETE